MKNTKRKSVMLLPETWKLLEESSKLTNLSASEVVNELIQMYWHRWTQHRLKRLEPYKKAPATRTPEPELDENVQDPRQDSTTMTDEEYDELIENFFKEEPKTEPKPEKKKIEIQPRDPNGGEDDLF